MKLLFIGNSHTFVHFVPDRVVKLCETLGVEVEAVMLTHPGMGLDYHLKQHQTKYNVMRGKYDAIVLQHNAHPFPGKEQLIASGEALAALIPDDRKIFLYMTWSEKNNRAGQAIMSESYEALAEKLGAAVCPVGRIWWQAADAHPNEELYYSDGEHSSVLGASLAASVIARTILGLDVNPGVCYADAKKLEADESILK